VLTNKLTCQGHTRRGVIGAAYRQLMTEVSIYRPCPSS
jgi:hypothetical protein